MDRLDLDQFTVLYLDPQDAHPHFENSTADKPVVEFYDKTYKHTPDGQFTGGRYYAATLLIDAGSLRTRGLDLNGGVPSWKVPAADMCRVFDWLKDL